MASRGGGGTSPTSFIASLLPRPERGRPTAPPARPPPISTTAQGESRHVAARSPSPAPRPSPAIRRQARIRQAPSSTPPPLHFRSVSLPPLPRSGGGSRGS